MLSVDAPCAHALSLYQRRGSDNPVGSGTEGEIVCLYHSKMTHVSEHNLSIKFNSINSLCFLKSCNLRLYVYVRDVVVCFDKPYFTVGGRLSLLVLVFHFVLQPPPPEYKNPPRVHGSILPGKWGVKLSTVSGKMNG